MQFKIISVIAFAGLALAAPVPHNGGGNGQTASNNQAGTVGATAATNAGASTGSKASGGNIIAQLQGTFDRNNPNGTPTNAGNPDDLNGDGVINVFEAGAQAS